MSHWWAASSWSLPDGLADVALLLAPHLASGLGVDLVAAGHETRGSQHWRGHVCGPDAAWLKPPYEGETLAKFGWEPLVWVLVVLEELLQEDGAFGARDRLHLGCEAGASVLLRCCACLLQVAHEGAVMSAELGEGEDGQGSLGVDSGSELWAAGPEISRGSELSGQAAPVNGFAWDLEDCFWRVPSISQSLLPFGRCRWQKAAHGVAKGSQVVIEASVRTRRRAKLGSKQARFRERPARGGPMHPGEAWLGEHLREKSLPKLGREVQGVNLDAYGPW